MTKKVPYREQWVTTVWPDHMFSLFLNMCEGIDGVNTHMVDDSVVCTHCRNVGLVILDESNDAVACPMCTLGFHHNVRWRAPMVLSKGSSRVEPAVVLHPSLWCWQPDVYPDFCSWERGLTIGHVALCDVCCGTACRVGELCAGCAYVAAG